MRTGNDGVPGEDQINRGMDGVVGVDADLGVERAVSGRGVGKRYAGRASGNDCCRRGEGS